MRLFLSQKYDGRLFKFQRAKTYWVFSVGRRDLFLFFR